MLYGVVIWGNASLFLLCFYIDHSNRIVLDKQVTSDRKKHISMAFRLCVLGCAFMAIESVHHLAICGVFSSKMRSCLSRWRQYMFQSSRDVNVMPWYSIGVVACSTSWNKQVTSDRKKHISMAFRLCVLGCALWQLRAYITLPFVGLIHPRWGFVYPVEGNTCSSRPGMSMWFLGTQLERFKMRRGVFATEMSDDTWTPWNFIVNYILTSRSPMHIADTYHFYLYWAQMFWDSISL